MCMCDIDVHVLFFAHVWKYACWVWLHVPVCVHAEIRDVVENTPWSLLELILWVKVSLSNLELANMASFLTSFLWDPLSFEDGVKVDSPCIPGIYVLFRESKYRPHSLDLVDILSLKLSMLRTSFCISMWHKMANVCLGSFQNCFKILF